MDKPNSLNSKGEFGGCVIPRLTIEHDMYKKKVNEIEDRKREEEEHMKWKELVDKVKGRRVTVTGSKRKTHPLVKLDPGIESPSKRKRGHPFALESTTQVSKNKPSETDMGKLQSTQQNILEIGLL